MYREEENKKLRKSQENPAIAEIYREVLGPLLGEKSYHLLHATCTPRARV